jgi:hypothetical protein
MRVVIEILCFISELPQWEQYTPLSVKPQFLHSISEKELFLNKVFSAIFLRTIVDILLKFFLSLIYFILKDRAKLIFNCPLNKNLFVKSIKY